MASKKEAAPVEEAPVVDAAQSWADYWEELVPYTAPLVGADGRNDITVGVNGKLLRIKRGETVMIKRKFLALLEDSAKQERVAYMTMQAAINGGSRPLAQQI